MRPSNIRHENIRQIIELFRAASEPLSRAELSRRLHLSAPSVSAIVSILLDKGVLHEAETGASGRMGGRRPILLELTSNCAYVMGIHIDSRTISLVVSDVSAERMLTHRTSYDRRSVDCLAFLKELIGGVMQEHGIPLTSLLSMGIAVPGVFDPKQRVIQLAPNIKQWEGIPLVDELMREFHCDVFVENVVNTAVVGERWQGRIRGHRNAMYIKIDQGIRAGILIDGRLYRGATHMEGEVGFVVTDWEGVARQKADYGALESVCSTLAIEQRVERKLERSLTFSQIVEQALAGQSELRNILLETAFHIGLTIANIVTVLNPEIVVIGGEYSQAAPIVADSMAKIIRGVVPHMPEFVFSDLGESVYCLGAIVMALDGIEDKLASRIVLGKEPLVAKV